jgi:hypothetical protein
MTIEIVDPRSVPGWDGALAASGDPSFFHTAGWASVLAEAYGYRPVYFLCRDRGAFALVWPCMEVRSRLTGTRGVSLPFTDSCPAFSRDEGLSREALERALEFGRSEGWRYVEWRSGGLPAHASYLTHDIGLGQGEEELFRGLKEANRRSIRKALREGVSVTFDSSSGSLEVFYRLQCLTRRRHGLPPQPFRFFKKIHEHVLSKGQGIVALSLHQGRPVAAAMFFMFGTQAIFKFGASDPARQALRPSNALMWESLRWLRSQGCTNLNLGRTEPEHLGLLRFKRAWGGTETVQTYRRYSFRKEAFLAGRPMTGPVSFKVLSRMPMPLLRMIGNLAYRHVG